MTTFSLTVMTPTDLPISVGTPLAGASKTVISDQINAHGFVVFRDYGISTAQDFHDFIEAFDLPNFTYTESFSNAVRHNRTSRVFTANEAPPEVEIFLHHEMAQTPNPPDYIFFYCNHAPGAGGATTLLDSRLAFETLLRIDPKLVD